MTGRASKGGGAKLPQGRQVASQNAKKHGLSLERASDPAERELVQLYLDELLDYYSPQSPLERMQLERVALCRAKLARLYEYERDRLELVRQRLVFTEDSDSLDLQQIDQNLASVAVSLAESRKIYLPLDIQVDEALAIAKESKVLGREVTKEDSLFEVLPSLHSLIAKLCDRENGEASPEDQLKELYGELENFMKTHEDDTVNIFSILLREMKLRRQLEAHGEIMSARASRDSFASPDEVIDTVLVVNKVVMKFQQIGGLLERASELVPKVNHVRELISRTVALPPEESDRLLRYQTSWERRLSSAVGEFLELRARGSRL